MLKPIQTLSFQPIIDKLSSNRFYPWVCLLFASGTLFWASIVIIGNGYMPPDDALRHVAQAVCQKDWPQILLVKDLQHFDIHFGWRDILYSLYDSGVPKLTLLQFSVVFFILINFLLPLFVVDNSEAWLISLILGLTLFSNVFRYSLGRPFLSQVACVAVIGLCAQKMKKEARSQLPVFAFLYALLTFSISLRAVWFIFIFPIGCFLLAGKLEQFVKLTVVWLLSTVTAGFLSGDFYTYIFSPLSEIVGSATRDLPSWMLVSELVPRRQSILFFLPVFFLICWKKVNNRDIRSCLTSPMMIMIALSWVFSMKINRFWVDFGVPAYLVWLYTEIDEIFRKDMKIDLYSLKRVGVTIAVCVPLFFIISGDFHGRWSRSVYTKAPDITETETREWLPDQGGIFYNISMRLFYKTFYTNPNAPWKYFLGMEASLMPDDDLDIYHQIVLSLKAQEKLELIVKKMTPKDRFVLEQHGKPDINGLEWFEIKPEIWSGRLPQGKPTTDNG